jgi:hypothetical protein
MMKERKDGEGEGEEVAKMVQYTREEFIMKLLNHMGREMEHDDMKDGDWEKPEGPNDGTEGPEMEEVSREQYLGKLFDGMQEAMAGADVSQDDI